MLFSVDNIISPEIKLFSQERIKFKAITYSEMQRLQAGYCCMYETFKETRKYKFIFTFAIYLRKLQK